MEIDIYPSTYYASYFSDGQAGFTINILDEKYGQKFYWSPTRPTARQVRKLRKEFYNELRPKRDYGWA